MPMYGEKKLEEFLGSIDARFPLSPIRGERRRGVCYLSSIWKDRSQPVRDIISLFIVDSGVPPRLISLSFFADPLRLRIGKCALLMGNTYPSRRRVSRDGVHLYT